MLPIDAGTVALLDEAAQTVNRTRGSDLPPASSLIVGSAAAT
jgi:hypothetical protein